MAQDVEQLRRDVSLASLASSYGVPLKKDGPEWVACCPFHSENTPSFTIYFGRDKIEHFHCFGCSAKGDVLDFVQTIKGVKLPEAIRILGGGSNAGPNIAPRKVEAVDVYAGIVPVDAPGEIEPNEKVRLYNPKRAGTDREYGSFVPSLIHPYRRADGSLVGYVLRHDLPEGRKETPMVMWVRLPDGKECWSRFPFPRPRTLYGLDALGDGQVFVVEGEKCRDAMVGFVRRNVMSWPGGTEGVKHTDWTPLAGRSVVIWPDADKPGIETANEIAATIAAFASRVRVIKLKIGTEKSEERFELSDWNHGADLPKGWDVADAVRDGWTKQDIEDFMRQSAGDWVPPPPEKTKEVVKAAAPPKAEAIPASSTAVMPIEIQLPGQEEENENNWCTHMVKKNGDSGPIKPGSSKNWGLLLQWHPDTRGVFAFDNFKLRIMLMRQPPWEWQRNAPWEPRVLNDRDYIEAGFWLQTHSMTVNDAGLAKVVKTIAERNSFDLMKDYLNGLVWDGTPRVNTWMTSCLGVEDTPYAQTVARCWLISSAARGLRPGCKVDTMPILEGPQGLNKSSAVKALYSSEFFSDNLSDIGNKDAIMELQGVWGLEVAEMHGMTMAETNQVKKFLSRTIDRYRPPYGQSVVEAHRRVVMVGTINPEGNAYLRDPTGARRFWPVVCGKIDMKAIERDRDQLWAEAVHRLNEGEPWWVQDDELVAVEVEQEKRTDQDSWTDQIVPLLKGAHTLKQWDIFDKLQLAKREVNYSHAARVGRIMKKLGWVAGRLRDENNDTVIYQNPLHVDSEKIDW